MFERFTHRARKSMMLAQEEARRLRHNTLTTGHLLLGLVAEEASTAARALMAQGVALPDLRSQVEKLLPEGLDASVFNPPLAASAKRAMELALREALELGHHHIGTEHLLLGIVREGDDVGAKAVDALSCEAVGLRARVMTLLDQTVSIPAGTATVLCPGCLGDLAGATSYRTIDAAGGAGAPIRPVVVVYCRRCGQALGAAPDAPAGRP